MKTIIFDVDGVITDTLEGKDVVIAGVLKDFNLLDIEGVDNILSKMYNRTTMLDEIYKLQTFDKNTVLKELNVQLNKLLNKTVFIDSTLNFILNNQDKYTYFINTSMPQKALEIVLKGTKLENIFIEKLCGEDGTKLEKTEYILEKYKLHSSDTLFIDDTIYHIECVKKSGAHTMHYNDQDINIENYIQSI